MALSDEVIEGALRIGLGKYSTDEEIEAASDLIADSVKQIRSLL
jgi:cysteine desulfurase